jgi:ribosomal-protein-serine acetyltransferase
MIGYWLDAACRGKGVMTEACRAFIDHGFMHIGLHRIDIRCAPANRKSCAIPERLGFVQEGTLRDAEWLYDHYVDLVVYSMLAPDWKKAHHAR